MTTTTVFNVLDLPGGVHAAGQAVVVRLIGTGFVVGDRREIIWESWTETDAAGRWEFPLTPNSEIGDGTYYEVVEPGGRTWAFVAPTSADPVWLKDELTEDPQPGGPVVVGVKTVNGQSPDPSGNVDVSGGTGTVQTVAGVTPVAGDVQEAALVAALAGSFATPEQGALADSAVQPGDLAAVATSGAYGDLSGRPTLGTAAAANSGDFDPAGAASSAQSAAIGAASSDATTKANAAQAFAIQRGNHTGTQSADSVVDGTTNKVLTAADKTRLAGTSGSNTGDETAATIKSKLGITTLSGSNTGDQDLSALATKASPALTGVPTAPTPAPGTNTTQIATAAFVVDAVTTAVAGLYDLRGTYNASGNTFPAAGGSGAAGAVLKGDVWIISVAGTLGGVAVVAGDQVLALVDAPAQTAGNWSIYEHDLGYVPENVANKSTDGTLAANSDTLYPSQKAAKTYADAKVLDSIADADTTHAPSRNAVFDALALKAAALTPTATKTATYTAAVGDLAMMNVAGGGAILNLPAAPANKAQIGVVAIGATTAAPLTINRGGSDTISTSGATSVTVQLSGEVLIYQYDLPNARWLAISNVKSLTALDARYATVTVGASIYGDGSDGTVTFDGTTTVLGMAPSASTYTMTRDLCLATATVNNGVRVVTNGYRLFVAGMLTNNGTISNNGGSSTSVSGGNGGGTGSVGTANPSTGGGGGNPGNGGAGTSSLSTLGGNGGAGGTGPGTTGGAGGTSSGPVTSAGSMHAMPNVLTLSGGGVTTRNASGGGGGGGDNVSSAGAGGGGGGGLIVLAASVIAGTGAIQARGGVGGKIGTGNRGAGGGGGGGVVVVLSASVVGGTVAGQTIDAAGGAGGIGDGTGGNGSAGTAGTTIIMTA